MVYICPVKRQSCWKRKLAVKYHQRMLHDGTALDAIVKVEEDHPGLLSRATAEAGSTVRLTAMDYAVLTEVCHLLHPFSDATKRLEAEDDPTSSLVIPAVIGIQNKMIKLNKFTEFTDASMPSQTILA